VDASVTAGWDSFFVAMAGAAAALAGLIIVAMTVTIKDILASKSLPSRAGATIASLVLVVVISGLALMPVQPPAVLGTELICVTAAVLVIEIVSAVRITQERPARPVLENAYKIILGIGQLVPILIGAILIASGNATGVFWVAGGILLTIAFAMMNAWVLLVEVQR
jgi:modulator of FtsH protease